MRNTGAGITITGPTPMNRRERRLAAKQNRRKSRRGAPSSGTVNPLLAHATRLHQSGSLNEAEAAYRDILVGNPDDPDALHQLGLLIAGSRSAQDGAAMMARAVALRPGFAEAEFNLGTILHQEGQVSSAIEHYEAALAARPGFEEAAFNLATAQLDIGLYGSAEASFANLLEAAPQHAKALNGLGVALQEQGRIDDAERAFRRAREADPREIDAYTNLGNLYYDRGEPEAARTAYAAARQVRPSDAMRIKEATVLPAIMGSHDEVVAVREAFDRNLGALLDEPLRVDDPYTEIGMTGFYLAYHGVNDRKSQETLAKVFLKATPSLGHVASHASGPVRGAPDGRLRIGFVSRHFANHTIGRLMRGLIAGLDRRRFEVTVLSWPHGPDPLAEEITRSADRTAVLPDTLADARAVIEAAALDILYYPDIGMEPLTYFLAFARLAPIQCVFWGHPMTTGLGSIDHFVSARDLEIEDGHEHYTEHLVRPALPTVSYRRPDAPNEAVGKSDFGLDEDGHCYLCPQTLFKFHPDFDPIIGRILSEDPKGRLVLIEGKYPEWQKRLMSRWRAAFGDAAERIRFLPRQGYDRFLSLLSVADVILDPVVFGGGNTTLEALAMGTPVVTLPGAFLRDRISYAWYRKMDLTDCVASDPDDYVRRAVALATNADQHAGVARSIADRSAILFDDAQAITGLEDALTKMADEKR